MLVLSVGATHEAHPSPRNSVVVSYRLQPWNYQRGLQQWGNGAMLKVSPCSPNLPTGNRLHLNPYYFNDWCKKACLTHWCSGSRTAYPSHYINTL